MASKDAFNASTFDAFSAENIPVIIAVIITPSLIDSSIFFF